MKKYHVAYSQAAKEDLFDIYSYIAFQLKEKGTAAKQVNRIRSNIRSLEKLPNRYNLVDWEPWCSLGLRKLPVNNYVVFYFVDEEANQVKIVRIVYGGRDLQSILNDEDDSVSENK